MTAKTYKGFKLVTHKTKGGYETFIFSKLGVKAIAKYSIGLAESACDYNDFAGRDHG